MNYSRSENDNDDHTTLTIHSPRHQALIELIADEDALHVQLDVARLGGIGLLVKGRHARDIEDGAELDGALRRGNPCSCSNESTHIQFFHNPCQSGALKH